MTNDDEVTMAEAPEGIREVIEPITADDVFVHPRLDGCDALKYALSVKTAGDDDLDPISQAEADKLTGDSAALLPGPVAPERWGALEEATPDKPSMDILSRQMEILTELRAKRDRAETEHKLLSAEFNDQGNKLLKMFEASGVDSLKGHGWHFGSMKRETIATPKTIDDKKALFAFLEENDIYFETVSVNSQTLNSLFKGYREAALEKGIPDFRMPGCGEPKMTKTLKMTRK